jgi:DNA-binding transcriptional MerR regulator
MATEIIHYPEDQDKLYAPAQAAYMAMVTLDFLAAVEQEGLLIRKTTARGGSGFTLEDVRRLVIIRRLHEDLRLDLPSIDVILHLREKVEELAGRRRNLEREMEEMEHRMERFRRLIERYKAHR